MGNDRAVRVVMPFERGRLGTCIRTHEPHLATRLCTFGRDKGAKVFQSAGLAAGDRSRGDVSIGRLERRRLLRTRIFAVHAQIVFAVSARLKPRITTRPKRPASDRALRSVSTVNCLDMDDVPRLNGDKPRRGGVARRTADVAATVVRYGFGAGRAHDAPTIERRMRYAAEDLGPTYVKLCQLIASSPGLFPENWATEMAASRDQVAAFPAVDARRIVEEDLAMPLRSVFAEFGDEPIAAASIAQVHPATLLDGSDVVVKVQRPGLHAIVNEDVRALIILAVVLERIPFTRSASPKATAEDFARTISEEIDFRIEADNMEHMRRCAQESEIDDMVIPDVYWDYVGPRTLTMQRVDGIGFDDIQAMRDAGIDTRRLLRMGVQSVVEGVLVHGFFHGDLHAGNMAVLPDGRFVLYDFGIVGRIPEAVRSRLASYLIASMTLNHEAMVRALQSFGTVPKDVDIPKLAKELDALYKPYLEGGINTANLGDLMDTMIRTMVKYRIRIPRELVLLSKQLLYLEGAAHDLAPDANLLEEQQLIYGSLMSKYPELAQDFFAAMADGDGGGLLEFSAPIAPG